MEYLYISYGWTYSRKDTQVLWHNNYVWLHTDLLYLKPTSFIAVAKFHFFRIIYPILNFYILRRIV